MTPYFIFLSQQVQIYVPPPPPPPHIYLFFKEYRDYSWHVTFKHLSRLLQIVFLINLSTIVFPHVQKKNNEMGWPVYNKIYIIWSIVDENGKTAIFTLRNKVSCHYWGLSLRHIYIAPPPQRWAPPPPKNYYQSAFFVDIHCEQYYFALKE